MESCQILSEVLYYHSYQKKKKKSLIFQKDYTEDTTTGL